MPEITPERRTPLKYHLAAPGDYGRGVCGAIGMMASDTPGYEVTCERCKRHLIFKAGKPASPAEKRVVRIDRSPMNARRWCLELECGHEEWVTSARKPTRKSAVCGTCDHG